MFTFRQGMQIVSLIVIGVVSAKVVEELIFEENSFPRRLVRALVRGIQEQA